MTPSDRWLSLTAVAADHRTNVFCFPFAGGGASFYRAWRPLAPGTIALCPLQPPGREERFREPPFASMPPLVRAASDALLSWLSRPYALFGHSMGALACFEIAHELRARGAPLPAHLFVSGAPAPHLAAQIAPIYDLPDDQLLEAMQRYGALPAEVLRSHELVEVLLPRWRADLAVTGTYVYAERPPLPCPITAFGGDADAVVAPESVEAWCEHTRSSSRCEILPGGHFFIAHHARSIVTAVARALA